MNNFSIKNGDYYILGWGLGNDNNPGTIDAPRATFGENSAIAGKKCVLRGVVEQNINDISNLKITGDSDARISGGISMALPAYPSFIPVFLTLRDLNVNSVSSNYMDMAGVRTTLTLSNVSYTNNLCRNNILVLNKCDFLGSDTVRWNNLTIQGFLNGCTLSSTVYDSIVYGDFDLYNYNNTTFTSTAYPVFRYSLFLKDQTVFKWNGNAIPIAWTVPGEERQDIIDSLKAYADASLTGAANNYLKSCADSLFGEGTVVYDDSPGHVRIFNGYDESGVPSDLNLNMQNGNLALFISSEGDYIGALRPAFKTEWDWSNLSSVDETGADIAETPDLLQENGGIFVNVYSQQKRNRVKATQVVSFPGGDRLSRIAAGFDSAVDRGIYFGAWQTEIDGSGLFPLDAMEADVYDTPATPSAYPHLLIPFNKNLEIAYFKTGEKSGQPVLFSDLEGLGVTTNKVLAEVAGWAVTNGAQEFYDVSALDGIEARKPRFKYILPVLTANKQD
jgi:hypothetical protein